METTAIQEETKPTKEEAEEADETDDESGDAERETVEEPAETKIGGGFFSPEGVIMLLLAIFLDTAGGILLFLNLAFPGASELFSPYLDMAGLVLIGAWMLWRTGRVSGTKGAKKVFGKFLIRLGLGFLSELTPFWGDIFPSWTLVVYFELRSK